MIFKDANLTVCSVSYNDLNYLEFQESILRNLASFDYKRLIINTSEKVEVGDFDRIHADKVIFIDVGTRHGSGAHGFALNFVFRHVETEYALLIDPDALLLQPGWDEVLAAELTGRTIAIGSPYSPEEKGLRYQDFPNGIIFFCKADPIKSLNLNWQTSLPWLIRKPLLDWAHTFPSFLVVE